MEVESWQRIQSKSTSKEIIKSSSKKSVEVSTSFGVQEGGRRTWVTTRNGEITQAITVANSCDLCIKEVQQGWILQGVYELSRRWEELDPMEEMKQGFHNENGHQLDIENEQQRQQSVYY